METDDRTKAELQVRRLWRHHGTQIDQPRRGPKQGLDLDTILAAAIALADDRGLAAVSTRAVASALGRTAMTLYGYVGSKDDLVALMQDHAQQPPGILTVHRSIAEDLQRWAGALFDTFEEHPWLTEIPWSAASQGPNEQDWLESLLAILAHYDVSRRDRQTIVTTLYAVVRATAQTSASYHRMDHADTARWLAIAQATEAATPDFQERYPHFVDLRAHSESDWRTAPRDTLQHGVRLLVANLDR